MQSLTATPAHRFFVVGRGAVPLGQLGIGTEIITRAGPPLVIASLAKHLYSHSIWVYNLEVQGDHTYFVGTADKGEWVHNSCNPDIYVIGRQSDTAVASGWTGHQVLNDTNWNINVNDAWIQKGVDEAADFYLASPINFNTLRSGNPAYPTTVFFRELQQLRAAGYGRVGDYMKPPGAW